MIINISKKHVKICGYQQKNICIFIFSIIICDFWGKGLIIPKVHLEPDAYVHERSS